ncbi:MAG: hypothetical protein KDK23_16805 [Leptospiraceae bacterium]|nr:hypothetical protein [Leptospiraceae bacterium]
MSRPLPALQKQSLREPALVIFLFVSVLMAHCSQLQPESEWDKENEFFAQFMLLQLGSQLVAPRVRFYNDTGSTQQFSLFPDASCSQSSIATFASAAQGQYTVHYQVSSFHLKIGTSECLAGGFDFGTPSSALQITLIDCDVNSTRVQCNDAASSTVIR